jgi:hypothetical protein
VTVDASAPVVIGLHYDSFSGLAACYQLLEAPPYQKGTCVDAVVEAGSYHVSVSGPVDTTYRIDLTCEPFDLCSACPVAGQIACGEKKTGQLGTDTCELYVAGESGGILQRRHRWSFDVSEAGFFEIRTDGGARATPWSVIRRSDCSPAGIAAREPCDGAGSPGVHCEVVRLEPGQYFIEVFSSGNASDAAPVDYSLEVACLDLGLCAACVPQRIDCGLPFQGALLPADCVGGDGSFANALLFEVPPPGASDVKFTVSTDGFKPRVRLVDRLCNPIPAGEGCAEGGGDTSVFVGTPPGTTVNFTVFPEDCDPEINVKELCQLVPGGTWSCALPPGGYRLAISLESFRVRQGGPLDYEVTLASTAGCSQSGGHLPGDCTQDGRIDLEDSICLLGYLFLGEVQALPCAVETPFDPGPGDIMLLDWDGNERLDITDPIWLLRHLFLSGPPHVLGEECVQVPACQGAGVSCGPD